MRRIVVTGMGLVTPLGIGLENVWGRLLAGESGIRAIQSFDVSDLPARVAAQVPQGDKSSGSFNADDWVPPKDQRRMDQCHRSHAELPFGDVETVEFQAGERAEPSLDLVKIALVDIHSHDPLCGCRVDSFQSVASRDPQHCDARRMTAIESILEEFRQDRQLPHARGAHVPFIIFQGYGEPGI